jgi:hypothetical protein
MQIFAWVETAAKTADLLVENGVVEAQILLDDILLLRNWYGR